MVAVPMFTVVAEPSFGNGSDECSAGGVVEVFGGCVFQPPRGVRICGQATHRSVMSMRRRRDVAALTSQEASAMSGFLVEACVEKVSR